MCSKWYLAALPGHQFFILRHILQESGINVLIPLSKGDIHVFVVTIMKWWCDSKEILHLSLILIFQNVNEESSKAICVMV